MENWCRRSGPWRQPVPKWPIFGNNSWSMSSKCGKPHQRNNLQARKRKTAKQAALPRKSKAKWPALPPRLPRRRRLSSKRMPESFKIHFLKMATPSKNRGRKDSQPENLECSRKFSQRKTSKQTVNWRDKLKLSHRPKSRINHHSLRNHRNNK